MIYSIMPFTMRTVVQAIDKRPNLAKLVNGQQKAHKKLSPSGYYKVWLLKDDGDRETGGGLSLVGAQEVIEKSRGRTTR